MLEHEFQYFTTHLKSLFTKYPNKYLVLQNQSVVLASDTFSEALTQAHERGLKTGTFIIQQCGADASCYTQTFHSRVKFNESDGTL